METVDARRATIGSPYALPLTGKSGRAIIGTILLTLTLVLLPVLADATWGGPGDLQKLSRVMLEIILEGSGVAAEGLTPEELRDHVTVLLRAKLPRLALTEFGQIRGAAGLAVAVIVQKLPTGRGYYGSIEISLFRAATIEATGKIGVPSVWHQLHLLTGEPMRERALIRETLDQAVTTFAADWYRGNP